HFGSVPVIAGGGDASINDEEVSVCDAGEVGFKFVLYASNLFRRLRTARLRACSCVLQTTLSQSYPF
ncbi:MAG TPA: hypothetical protein VH230_11925, partial [Stellaceae bacterium]|nr:hypothetical protein [Stellaceae bacterium]